MAGFLVMVLPQVSFCSKETLSQFTSLFVKLCAGVMEMFQREEAALAVVASRRMNT